MYRPHSLLLLPLALLAAALPAAPLGDDARHKLSTAPAAVVLNTSESPTPTSSLTCYTKVL
jgi:hypothetical protein